MKAREKKSTSGLKEKNQAKIMYIVTLYPCTFFILTEEKKVLASSHLQRWGWSSGGVPVSIATATMSASSSATA